MPPANDLFLRINAFAADTPWLHGPSAAFATYGILVSVGLMVAGWWLARRRDARTMATALLVPVAALAAFAVQQVVVMIVDEARPYAVHPDALVLIGRTTDPSFPATMPASPARSRPHCSWSTAGWAGRRRSWPCSWRRPVSTSARTGRWTSSRVSPSARRSRSRSSCSCADL